VTNIPVINRRIRMENTVIQESREKLWYSIARERRIAAKGKRTNP